jgi:hypothetical protein
MATGLFHRHARAERSDENQETADTTVADAPGAEERQATNERPGVADRVMGRRHESPVAGEPVPPGGAVDPVPAADTEVSSERERAEAAERDRAEAQREAAAARQQMRRAHTSFAATLSLIIGVCAVLAALSGRLAPVAVVAGVIGLLFAAVGLAAVSRRTVTGHHVAIFGLVFSLVGIVFGFLAINKSVPWLNGDADQASQFRSWLDAHWAWLKNW